MAVTITMPHQPFPAFNQSAAHTWASDPSQQTFVRVHPIKPRKSLVPPNLAFHDLSKPAFGVSIIKTDAHSISSPKSPSIADKSLPPTPFGEAFGDAGRLSPDSDRLLDESGEDVEVSSELPSQAMLEEAASLPIIDAHGVEMPFRNVYMPSCALEKKRVMVIFVRHFFCGVSNMEIPTFLSLCRDQGSIDPLSHRIVRNISDLSHLRFHQHPLYNMGLSW